MKCLLVLFLLIMPLAGCSVWENSTAGWTLAPLAYNPEIQYHHTRDIYHRSAKSAWSDFARSNPDVSFSTDYAHGFTKGYADYLFYGGSVKAPSLPPKHYWKPRFQSPSGHQAVYDWFTGFEDGALMAQQTSLPENVRKVPTTSRYSPPEYQNFRPGEFEVLPEPTPAAATVPRQNIVYHQSGPSRRVDLPPLPPYSERVADKISMPTPPPIAQQESVQQDTTVVQAAPHKDRSLVAAPHQAVQPEEVPAPRLPAVVSGPVKTREVASKVETNVTVRLGERHSLEGPKSKDEIDSLSRTEKPLAKHELVVDSVPATLVPDARVEKQNLTPAPVMAESFVAPAETASPRNTESPKRQSRPSHAPDTALAQRSPMPREKTTPAQLSGSHPDPMNSDVGGLKIRSDAHVPPTRAITVRVGRPDKPVLCDPVCKLAAPIAATTVDRSIVEPKRRTVVVPAGDTIRLSASSPGPSSADAVIPAANKRMNRIVVAMDNGATAEPVKRLSLSDVDSLDARDSNPTCRLAAPYLSETK